MRRLFDSIFGFPAGRLLGEPHYPYPNQLELARAAERSRMTLGYLCDQHLAQAEREKKIKELEMEIRWLKYPFMGEGI